MKPLLQYNTENASGKDKNSIGRLFPAGHVTANKKSSAARCFFEKSILLTFWPPTANYLDQNPGAVKVDSVRVKGTKMLSLNLSVPPLRAGGPPCQL